MHSSLRLRFKGILLALLVVGLVLNLPMGVNAAASKVKKSSDSAFTDEQLNQDDGSVELGQLRLGRVCNPACSPRPASRSLGSLVLSD